MKRNTQSELLIVEKISIFLTQLKKTLILGVSVQCYITRLAMNILTGYATFALNYEMPFSQMIDPTYRKILRKRIFKFQSIKYWTPSWT